MHVRAVHAFALLRQELLRVPGERSETRDPGPKTREPTIYRPWVPALASATPIARRRRA